MKGKAKKKKLIVEAIQYKNYDNIKEYIESKSSEKFELNKNTNSIYIYKKVGKIELRIGDWLLFDKINDKQLWVIDDSIFKETYYKKENDKNMYIKRSIINEFYYFDKLDQDSILKLLKFLNINSITKTELNTIIANKEIKINTLEGVETLKYKEYIIKGIKGEYYPIKSDVFNSIYKIVKVDQ